MRVLSAEQGELISQWRRHHEKVHNIISHETKAMTHVFLAATLSSLARAITAYGLYGRPRSVAVSENKAVVITTDSEVSSLSLICHSSAFTAAVIFVGRPEPGLLPMLFISLCFCRNLCIAIQLVIKPSFRNMWQIVGGL